jgi:hypothetical protein
MLNSSIADGHGFYLRNSELGGFGRGQKAGYVISFGVCDFVPIPVERVAPFSGDNILGTSIPPFPVPRFTYESGDAFDVRLEYEKADTLTSFVGMLS